MKEKARATQVTVSWTRALAYCIMKKNFCIKEQSQVENDSIAQRSGMEGKRREEEKKGGGDRNYWLLFFFVFCWSFFFSLVLFQSCYGSFFSLFMMTIFRVGHFFPSPLDWRDWLTDCDCDRSSGSECRNWFIPWQQNFKSDVIYSAFKRLCLLKSKQFLLAKWGRKKIKNWEKIKD